MPKRKKIIWIAVGLVVLIGIIYFSFFRKAKVEYNTTAVQKSELSQTVSVTGTLKANETISLNFETTGRVKSVEARVGQKVGKGDVIGYLDDAGLQFALDQAKANLEKAQADAGVSYDTIHSAEVGKSNAEKYLDDTKSLNKKNITAVEQRVSDTKEYLEDAESYYDKVEGDSGADSSTAKLAKLTLDTAEANYEQAKDALDVAEKTADLSETSAENSLETAKATLAASKSKYISASKDATVASSRAAYETALNNLDKAVLRAPASGVIKEMNYKIGEIIGSTSAVSFAKMISFDYILEAKVPESDIAKIKVGQTAEISFDAFSADEKLEATIVSIDPSATVVQDVVDYVVKLAMDTNDPRLKDGMSADVDISIQKKRNTISIPERAVQEKNGKKIVQILENGKPVDREVQLGLQGDGGSVEIVSGLKEGEKIITSTK